MKIKRKKKKQNENNSLLIENYVIKIQCTNYIYYVQYKANKNANLRDK